MTQPVYEVIKKGCEPLLGSKGAGGLDLRADMRETWIQAGIEYKIGTGVKVSIPTGWVGLLLPRSSLGVNYKLRLLNTVGVIDSDYRDEIIVACTFEESFWLEENERICQLVTIPCRVDYVAGTVENDTERGTGKFGSTGKQ